MYKVIIVDDEMIVRHAVKTIIKWEDSRFEYAGSASSGVSAMELVRRTNADIVITDIKMAEMDGLKLIKGLMADGFKGEVLVLSNYNDFDLVREALKFGAYDYMLKLTLKTETFMQTLEEMAAKLDAKRSHFKPQTTTVEQADGELEQLYDLLKKHDLGEELQLSPNILNQKERQAISLLKGLCCYTFTLYMPDGEHQNHQTIDFHETLEKLAEGLFPNKHFLFVFHPRPNRYIIIIATPLIQNMVDPEEIAQRLIKLSEMYYGLDISVIYGQAATSFKNLIEQMSLNREAEALRFYAAYQEGCQSNARLAVDTNEGFRTAEAKLRESLRGSGDSAIERWVESAFLLMESAAKHRIHSKSLKRILAGGIWGLSNVAALQMDMPWDEKGWLEKVEAADSDSSLKLLIKEISDEILGSLGKGTQLSTSTLRQEIRLALAYLDKHFADRVSISDVASYVALSEPYLCQLFKAETGSSILTRLNEIRMNRAYEMLLSGKYLVKQVAIEVGIPDPFYFNRLFRKRFGHAPKNIKKTPPV
ncbi:Two-component response regulator, YesN/AraC family, consists of REC and AraC-type DNA-binding domains [Paenibacillus algorifonticola]|uniref:Two-component response regulator, YesN/AraC family, consists of REC and AraC-type DNA-binding domains n=1 Tax=Paenibacillus algorifonticola TaxID=684063 RepID=A0A1I2FKK3_9BACL|nr:response regulator [Paenibacillus algorifonticola]SFF05046.1 Two-component response regulator, YesN/AraC family, consists of REC and AraC-type DNA-binding domains [Paenibacillus algorifonticola]